MTSERTADEQLVANIRADLVAQEHLYPGTSYGRVITDKITALDRLVARNQQLQEALTAAERVVEMFNEQAPEWMQDEDWPLLAGLRAALESVHTRTPQ